MEIADRAKLICPGGQTDLQVSIARGYGGVCRSPITDIYHLL